MQPLTKLVCPHCHAILKSNKPLRPGKQVSCLKCQAPFSVSPSDVVAVGSVQEILVSSTLAEDADQVELAIDVPGDSCGECWQPPVEIPVGVLEKPAPVAEKPLVAAPYFPPPVPKSIVPIAAPFLPPPAQNGGARAAALVGLVVLLGCGAALFWYATQRDSDAQEHASHQPKSPDPEKVAGSNGNSSNQEMPISSKEKPAELPQKGKPASFEEPNKQELEPKKPVLKKRIRPAPPMQLGSISFALPEAEQAKVDAAIKRGVKYLKSQQLRSGSWSAGAHTVGYAALPGLTLLECQVPPSDLSVQWAAYHVRSHSETLTDTYDLSLAILFLDRLGDRRDRYLIQKLALRLVAGQKESGGWDYQCPLLSQPEMNELMLALHQNRPKAATLLYPLPKDLRTELANPLQKPGSENFPNAISKDKSATKPGKDKDTKLIPPGDDPGKGPDSDPKKPAGTKPKVLPKGAPPAFMPPNMKKPPFAKRGKRKLPGGRIDHSNTQFALLGLWAARRHDVPTENTLTRAQKHFQDIQNRDDGWGYVPGYGSSDAMTGAGLLGLAMGHGASERGILAAVDARANKSPAKAHLQDRSIAKGLQAFGKYVGTPDLVSPRPAMVNLYFLWTLERVAMIYNLQTIGNKDWYRWGVRILLPNQTQQGSWFGGHYPGSAPTLDTCFALLFLKRSNLVRDLTENLDLLLAITDPDAESSKKR